MIIGHLQMLEMKYFIIGHYEFKTICHWDDWKSDKVSFGIMVKLLIFSFSKINGLIIFFPLFEK